MNSQKFGCGVLLQMVEEEVEKDEKMKKEVRNMKRWNNILDNIVFLAKIYVINLFI